MRWYASQCEGSVSFYRSSSACAAGRAARRADAAARGRRRRSRAGAAAHPRRISAGHRHSRRSHVPGVGDADHADPKWRAVRSVSLGRPRLSQEADRCRAWPTRPERPIPPRRSFTPRARWCCGRARIRICRRRRSICCAPRPEAAGHRQSRPRAVRPRRGGRAYQPQALRRAQAAHRHRGKHRAGGAVCRLGQRRCGADLAHLGADAAACGRAERIS